MYDLLSLDGRGYRANVALRGTLKGLSISDTRDK